MLRWGLLVLGLILFNVKSPAQISAPRVGLVRYSSGGVYPVLGVPGNYLVGQRLYDAVAALSFSRAGGLFLRGGTLQLINPDLQTVATVETGATEAAVDIQETVGSAIAWIPAQSLLMHWDGRHFKPVALAEGVAPAHVFHVQKIDDMAAILLARSTAGEVEEYRVSLRDGTLLARSVLPELANAESGTSYAFPQGNSYLVLTQGQLFTVSPESGQHTGIPIHAADVQFERTSSTAVHLHSRTSGRDWLVQFTGDQAALYELPIEKVAP